MSDSRFISRRAVVAAIALASVPRPVAAQGFAGLGSDAEGFARVLPNVPLEFPRDHGSHKNFRIEWWYLTANLQDSSGIQYGAQWTLFRQATHPDDSDEGWDSRQLWMAHAAVTSAGEHRYTERLARGGVGQAGVDAVPFRAWIDSWQMSAGKEFSSNSASPVEVSAIGPDFDFSLQLTSEKPVVLQGEGGFSKKSERGQASYYFSQPFFSASGHLTFNNARVPVSGKAWMDREWSSQPLAPDQAGWDWLSLHLDSGEKIMLFRMRGKNENHFFSANWISADGASTAIASQSIEMSPTGFTELEGKKLPTSWKIWLRERDLQIAIIPLNPKSWMGTRFAYWEGPITFSGSHSGVGYLEMTGY